MASWIELNAQNFLHNIHEYRKFLGPHTKLGCVLKGNAYGHGFQQTLPLFHQHTDMIFVIEARDAFAVRNYEKAHGLTSRRVVVLGSLSPEELIACAVQEIEVVIIDTSFERYFGACAEAAGTPLKVHLHMDTGLSREGFLPEHFAQELEFLNAPLAAQHVDVVGFMTHFSNVEDVTEQTYAEKQLQLFEEGYQSCIQVLNLQKPPERHTAQSAASFILPSARYHLARVGIGLYGLWPSGPTRLSTRVLYPENAPRLLPTLSWRTSSQQVKVLPAGSYIGYGCTYRAAHEIRIALLPVGYFDGYPREFSNRGYVLVQGQRCPILGRVMMNHTIVDVSHAVSNNDPLVATLLGTDGHEQLTAEQLAEWSNTINYEIVTRIGPHLERRMV